MSMDPKTLAAAQAAIVPAQAHVEASSQKPVYEVTADAIEKNRHTPQYTKIMAAYAANDKNALLASLNELNSLSADERTAITGQLMLDAATKLSHPSLLIDIGRNVTGAKDMQFQFPGEQPENLYALLKHGHVSPNLNIPRWEKPEGDMPADIVNAMNKPGAHIQEVAPPKRTPAGPQPPGAMFPYKI